MLNNINIQGEYKKKRKTKALASLRKQAAVQPQKKRHGYVVICSLVSFWLGFNVTLYWLIHYHIISLSSPHGLKGKAWNERGEIEILAGSEPSQPIIRMKFRWCVCVWPCNLHFFPTCSHSAKESPSQTRTHIQPPDEAKLSTTVRRFMQNDRLESFELPYIIFSRMNWGYERKWN